ncbi:MAG: uroporphyrinogen-III synthase [Candidatus Hydrothermarchaeales archaeon]
MRIAITRPRERSKDTIKLLEDRGEEAFIVPAIEIVPRQKNEVTKAVGSLESYAWLILTSASGAAIMLDYFGDDLKKIKIGVIGPKTKEILEKKGIEVALIPEEYKAENLADELIKQGIGGDNILIARASIGREVLVDKLKAVANVTNVHLYDTTAPKDTSEMQELSLKLEKNEIDAIIFTSSQTAKNLFEVVDPEKVQKSGAKICAIGPITARTLQDFGIEVDIMPKKYTVKAALDALEGKNGR